MCGGGPVSQVASAVSFGAVRTAAALAVSLLSCSSGTPCSTCDCGRAGIFRVDALVPPPLLGGWESGDEALSNGTLTYGDVGDGRASTLVGPMTDGGTLTVATNHGLGLNPNLKPTAIAWYSEDHYNYQSAGAAFSFADRGVQLIVHDGSLGDHQGPVIAPVTSYFANPDAGTVEVTLDGQTISARLHQPVAFTRRGAAWCFAADEATYRVTALSHWVVFQLDALSEL